MRVVNISPTAGGADPLQDSNYMRSTNFGPLGYTQNVNGNFQQTNLYSQSAFMSSADEFVQRALTSASTDYRLNDMQSDFSAENVIDNSNGATTAMHQNLCHDGMKSAEDACNNPYRVFKEVFNSNRCFYADCGKDFENITSLEFEIEPSLDTENHTTELALNTTHQCHHESNDFDNTNNDTIMKNSIKWEENCCCSFSTSEAGETYAYNNINQEINQDVLNENRKDHKSCDNSTANDNSKYEVENDGDDYFLSSTSSTTSLHTPKRTYFPRGIINPNYPGFQHLAHTLSEHFIGSSTSDSYDTDASEYDMEVSMDSCDDFSEDQTEMNKQQSCKHNNNHTNSLKSTNVIDEEEEAQDQNKYDGDDFATTVGNVSCNTNITAITSNKLLNTSGTPLAATEFPNGQNINEDHYSNSSRPANQFINTKENLNSIYNYGYTTPDILLKNHSFHVETISNKEERPDLLRGVSPSPQIITKNATKLDNISIDCYTTIKQSYTVKTFNSGNFKLADITKDEGQLGITPVDIIGDFGQEVEREFGLLVSGYRRLVDGCIEMNECNRLGAENQQKNTGDAVLSKTGDQIDSMKFLAALNELSIDTACKSPFETKEISLDYHSGKEAGKLTEFKSAVVPSNYKVRETMDNNRINETNTRKYQKSSYDDRQLPPVAIEYKRCQQRMRTTRRVPVTEKKLKTSTTKVPRAIVKSKADKTKSSMGRKREESEIHQYQQLISDKEEILSNSKYANMSSWALYLQAANDGGVKNSSELISPSALELFEAYKIGSDIDVETLHKHLKLAKEIEKKRRNDRDEIRRRLAMGTEEIHNQNSMRSAWKPSIEERIQKGINLCHLIESASDTESHSSDSETCPKLSKLKQHNASTSLGISPCINQEHRRKDVHCDHCLTEKQIHHQTKDETHDFFTKQAKLQIEARMALSQAKEMAHMQMQIDRQNQRISLVTEIIRESLKKVGIQMTAEKRRLSRQMLTEMNIAQLQILVNSIHTHIEKLNETLMHFLMERDDLHVAQDSMLIDIEELTRYLGQSEHLAQQRKKLSSTGCNHLKDKGNEYK